MKRTAILVFLIAVACQKQETAPPTPKHAAKPAAPPVEKTQRTEVGDTMPAYAAEYLDGKPFDLASKRGSVVFVNVWATWCGPCRMEIPELQKMHDKFRGRGFEVVGVSVDDTGAEGVKKFVADQKISYPIVLDAEGKLANVLQTNVLPTSVMVDRNGKIVWRQVGALMPNDVAGVEAIIEKAVSSDKTKRQRQRRTSNKIATLTFDVRRFS